MAASNSFPEKSLAQESSINDSYLAPEARFECPICLAWLRDPLLTSCGHRFCRRCIESWLQRENPRCPVDNMNLTKDDIFPDNFTRREINQQRTKCPNIIRGCLEQLNPLDVESHLLICAFKLPELPENEKLRCSFVHLGCEDKFEDEVELENHLKQQIHKHLNMILGACNKLTISQSANSVIAQEAKFWDAPSKSEQPSGSETSSVDELLRALYEKHVILEQKTREQDIIIANMSEQIQSQSLALSKMTLRHCSGCYLWYLSDFKMKLGSMRNDNRLMHYSPGFYTSLNGYRNADTVVLCALLHFTLTLRSIVSPIRAVLTTTTNTARLTNELQYLGWLQEGNVLTLTSFFVQSITSVGLQWRGIAIQDCWLCIRLNISPNNPSSIAILIHMMKTEHDNTLDWPFSGRLTITLVHPTDASKNIKETMMTRPNLEAFQRPIQDMNPKGFGYTEFTSIDEILSQSFIDNNQLIIKVQAQPV